MLKSVKFESHPGGCEIGPRPIDLHIKSLKLMGANIKEANGYIYCSAAKLRGADITLRLPSVGATENIMLASVFAEGRTIIRNAAKEPEIVDLQEFLKQLGVNVAGAGTSTIVVEGKKNEIRCNVEHSIIPDRIVAGTIMAACAITAGDVTLTNVVPEHMSSIISNLVDAGCNIQTGNDYIRTIAPARLTRIDKITTMPYPGFPTDMQAQFTAILSVAEGTSIIVETVFKDRYKHVDELIKMGADIKLEDRTAVITGVNRLMGANVEARDLRGGAALVLAGLAAAGTTVVSGVKHIDRGYESLEQKLAVLGAKIKRK